MSKYVRFMETCEDDLVENGKAGFAPEDVKGQRVLRKGRFIVTPVKIVEGEGGVLLPGTADQMNGVRPAGDGTNPPNIAKIEGKAKMNYGPVEVQGFPELIIISMAVMMFISFLITTRLLLDMYWE